MFERRKRVRQKKKSKICAIRYLVDQIDQTEKYYIFRTLALEIVSPWGHRRNSSVKFFGVYLDEASSDQTGGNYIHQRISLAIQKGNFASLIDIVSDI